MQLAPLLDRVALWFWGHEHRMAVYENFNLLSPGLKRGRCIGCGAFPVPVDEEPAKPLFPEVRMVPKARLGRGPALYHHGYVTVDLAEGSAGVSYYQDSDERAPVYKETLSSSIAAGN
jgi:hypothetical protein